MPVAPVCHIVQSRNANAATIVTATISTNQADSDGALYYESLKGKVGSPNVPPGIASRIVQVSIANAAFQTVLAIAAKQADSQKTKGHRVALSIPKGNVGSPKAVVSLRCWFVVGNTANADPKIAVAITANQADSDRTCY